MKRRNIITAMAAIIIAYATNTLFISCDSGSEALHPGFDAGQGIRLVIPEGYEGYLDPSAGEPAPPLKGEELAGYGNQAVAGYSGNQAVVRHCEGSPEAIQNAAQGENLDCFVPRNDGTLTTSPLSGEMPVGQRGQRTSPLSGEMPASRQRGQSTPPLSGEVPASRAEGSKTRLAPDPTGACTWNQGDRLYIGVAYYDDPAADPDQYPDPPQPFATRQIIATYNGSAWDLPTLAPPQGTEKIRIRAHYTGGTLPGDWICQDDFLISITDHLTASGGKQITLGRFLRQCSRFTFTGLQADDVVRLSGGDLTLSALNKDYLGTSTRYTSGSSGIPGDPSHSDAISITVPTNQTEVSCYASISRSIDFDFAYDVTRSGKGTSTTHIFNRTNPGEFYRSMQFQINCTGIFATGSGSETPATAEEKEIARLLQWIEDYNAGRRSDFTLACSIDVNSIPNFPQIGSASRPFSNTFDGGGFSIIGLKMKIADGPAGLFYNIGSAGKVTNLHLQEAEIQGATTGYSTGGLAAGNNGTISHCTLSGTAVSGSTAGGVVGNNYGRVTACTFAGTVTATGGIGNAGGITATNSTTGSLTGIITACVSRATRISGYDADGIAGWNADAILTACTSGETIIQATAGTGYPSAGGIVGYNEGTATVTACYSRATSVTGPTGTRTGGILGWNNTSTSTITACHWLTGSSDQPTNAARGITTGVTACYSFTSPATFYANGATAINMMTHMNGHIGTAGWEWKDASEENEYPIAREKP